MESFGERVFRLRKEKDLTQTELAVKSGVSQTTISDIERGRNAGSSEIVALAAALGVDAAVLKDGRPSKVALLRPAARGNTSPGPDITGRVPLISWIAASAFAQIIDNFQPGEADEWVPTTVPIHKHTYALRVDGPSMTNPTGQEPTFPHGCKIVIEPDLIDDPQNMVGLFVIVRRADEDTATFKQLIRDGSRYLLHPLNPQFDNIALQEGDVFCGVVREKPVRYV